jgi:uncharacterized damage-inducible protein DinB
MQRSSPTPGLEPDDDGGISVAGHTLEIEMLVAYVEEETKRWRQWFAQAPLETLAIPLGRGADGAVRTLIKHIFAVELRYAQRLVGEPVSGYEELPCDTVEQLWGIHERAGVLRDRFLQRAGDDEMEQVLVSETRKLGRIESRAHVVVTHTLIHGIRHWAQIAALLREHGHRGLWEHDWLLSPVVQERRAGR